MAAAKRFWSAPAAPVGAQVELYSANQGVQRGDAQLLDPADLVYPAPGGGLLRVPVGGGAPVPVNGTGNGNIWYYDQAAGLWVPTAAAPVNNDVARWNAAQNRYDFVPLVSPGELAYFDNSLSPVARYAFDKTLADFSGNGFDLSVSAGAIGYAPIFPGRFGVLMSSGTFLSRPAFDALLAIPGDVSIMMVLQADSNATAQPLACFAASGETQATNTLWLAQISLTSTPPRRMSWLSESGAGVDASATSGGTDSIGLIHNVMFLGWRRLANVIRFYINGKPIGPDSAALTTPDGGTSSRLFMGCSPGTGCIDGIMLTSQIVARACSDAEFLAAYNQSMGPAFGRLS